MLGRTVLKQIGTGDWDVCGLCSNRRSQDGLVCCDLTSHEAVDRVFTDFAPDIVIHMAAERHPDIVHRQPEQTQFLNIGATAKLSEACQRCGAWLIFLSTDYVFDGTQPPYTVGDVPNPLSTYGKQKLEGERIVLQDRNAAVLRVPLLFGQINYYKESSVTALYEEVVQGLDKADHTQKRYPTCTDDVARVIKKMVEVHCRGKVLCGVFHWQSDECFTKYDMVQTIAELKGIDASAVIADMSVPRHPRPMDSRLDCGRLVQELEIDPMHFRTPFRDALEMSWHGVSDEPRDPKLPVSHVLRPTSIDGSWMDRDCSCSDFTKMAV
jgi:S-adenosylmethionine synthetase